MGFGKSLKKIGKKLISTAINPKNLINPLAGVAELGKDLYGDYKEGQKKQKAEAEVAERKAIEASNKAFSDNLDSKRRAGQKSNVIFAGVLGAKGKVGLGGQKSLLGL